MSDMKLNTLSLSRRALLTGAGRLAGVGAMLGFAAMAAPAAAGSKVSKTMAHYQPTPKGPQRCDGCVQYVGPSACKVVDGDVAAAGWCLLYAKK
jgi:hypothetical protein